MTDCVEKGYGGEGLEGGCRQNGLRGWERKVGGEKGRRERGESEEEARRKQVS